MMGPGSVFRWEGSGTAPWWGLSLTSKLGEGTVARTILLPLEGELGVIELRKASAACSPVTTL